MNYNHSFKKLATPFFGISYEDLLVVIRKCEGAVIPPKREDIFFCYFNGNWRIGSFYVLWKRSEDDCLMECSCNFNMDNQPKWNPRAVDLEDLKNTLHDSLKLPIITNLNDNYDEYTTLAVKSLQEQTEDHLFYHFLGAKNDILKNFKKLIYSLSSVSEEDHKGKRLYILSDNREGECVLEFIRQLPIEDYVDDMEQINYLFWMTSEQVKAALANKITVELARGE